MAAFGRFRPAFGRFWTVLVGFGVYFGSGRFVWVEIFIYVGAGLDGFGRFWSVVADNLVRIFTYIGAGLDGFERFSTLLDAIF